MADLVTREFYLVPKEVTLAFMEDDIISEKNHVAKEVLPVTKEVNAVAWEVDPVTKDVDSASKEVNKVNFNCSNYYEAVLALCVAF